MKREMESNNFAKKKGQNSSFIKEDGSKRFWKWAGGVPMEVLVYGFWRR